MQNSELTDNDRIACDVRNFYNGLPFNYRSSVQEGAEFLKKNNLIDGYPDAHKILKNKGANLLDVGCGTGWFSNSAAYYYGIEVSGIDLSESAIKRAIEASKILGLRHIEYYCCDLFNMPFKKKFYFVNSLGVLHHTHNCRAALSQICKYVREGGFVHIGLYHAYGRKPFLDLFQKYRERILNNEKLSEHEIEEALKIYKELNPDIKDEVFLDSWFRDQVLHPHETQHTLKEVYEWLINSGFNIVSTSINRFEKITNIQDLFDEEKKYYELSVQMNVIQKKYFPGFFTVLAQKEAL